MGECPNENPIQVHFKFQLCTSKESHIVSICESIFLRQGREGGWHVYKLFRNEVTKHFPREMIFAVTILLRNSTSLQSHHFGDI